MIINLNARAVRRRAITWWGILPNSCVWQTRTLVDLDAAIRECRASGVRIVAGLGGDGTQHHLLEAVLRHYPAEELPALLPLAGGTLNGIARSWKSHGAPVAVLKTATARLADGTARFVSKPVLQIEDRSAGVVHFGFGLAAGVPFRIATAYYKTADPGFVSAVCALILLPLRDAITGGPLFDDVRLTATSNTATVDAHTVAASVLDDPLLWFRPFGIALTDDVRFHFAATSMKPRAIVLRLWSIYRGRCRHPTLYITQSREASVRGTRGYLIDGDLYGDETELNLVIRAGPQFRFLSLHS